MNQNELDRSLRKLRLSGMAATLPTRILQAQAENLSPHDFLASLVHDELNRRTDRLVERRVKQAGFRVSAAVETRRKLAPFGAGAAESGSVSSCVADGFCSLVLLDGAVELGSLAVRG